MNKGYTGERQGTPKSFWANIDKLNKVQKKEIVINLLQNLESKERAIVSLFYFEQLSTTEIQYVMNCDRDLVHTVLLTFSDSVREMAFKENNKFSTIFH